MFLEGFHCSIKGNISRDSMVCCLSMAIEKCITSIGGQTKYLKLCCYFVVMVQSNQIDLCWKRYQLILISILSCVLAEITAISSYPTFYESPRYVDLVHLLFACKMHIVSEMDLYIEYCLYIFQDRPVSSRGQILSPWLTRT